MDYAIKHIDNEYLYENNKVLFEKSIKIFKKLNKEEKEVLRGYKGIQYIPINKVLRSGKYMDYRIDTLLYEMATAKTINPETDKITPNKLQELFLETINKPIQSIIKLDKIFKKIEVHDIKIPLYRGAALDNLKYRVGSTITFNEYLSTSLSPSVAFNFQGCGEKPCCIFIFHLKHKIPNILLNYGLNSYKNTNAIDEHELMLPRHTNWKVINKYNTDIHPNLSFGCSYDKIEHSKKNKITVYEFESLPYEFPKELIELTLDKYNDLQVIKPKKGMFKQNKNFFMLHNNLQIQTVE